ncbi:hypothetical protein GPJ56_002446 [Histomonas meleagridis]|uniref:uncharacterized protein n=1 Tax=Histomonas meleagridis TaxID=135588 RepID=UPI00355A3134|nr:hypothetical protein GPJ56_002446 [Histomonas meleagridis]KAH0798269.1 hypothetical protein GO595_008957 [Histomonas meleagridis]
MPDKYRRPSRKLIELRQTAHNLALCGNFDEAQERKVEAENLEIKETEEAQKRLNKEYSIAKNKLIRKQAEEVRAFQENAQQQRDILISKKHVAEQASNNRKNVLNLKPSQKSRLTSSLRSSGSPTRPIVTRRSHNRNIEKKLPPLRPPKEEAQQNNKTNSQFKDPKKQQKHKPIEEEHTNMESDKKDEELELKPLVIETNQNENEENENESNNEQEVQTPKSESE